MNDTLVFKNKDRILNFILVELNEKKKKIENNDIL